MFRQTNHSGSLAGFSDEVTEPEVRPLRQGFNFVAPDAAQYQISGSSAGSVQGRVVDRFAKSTLLSRAIPAHGAAAGAGVRRRHRPGHHRQKRHRADKIAFKVEAAAATAKYTRLILTGHKRQAITHDETIVRPVWVRDGWRFITRRKSPATRHFLPQTRHRPAPGHCGYSRLNTSRRFRRTARRWR